MPVSVANVVSVHRKKETGFRSKITVGIDSREETYILFLKGHFRTKLYAAESISPTGIDDVKLVLHGNRLPWVELDTEDTIRVVARHELAYLRSC